MYTEFHLRNFRLLNNLQVRELRRVNLIVGKNNTGKASLLEAIFLLGAPRTRYFP